MVMALFIQTCSDGLTVQEGDALAWMPCLVSTYFVCITICIVLILVFSFLICHCCNWYYSSLFTIQLNILELYIIVKIIYLILDCHLRAVNNSRKNISYFRLLSVRSVFTCLNKTFYVCFDNREVGCCLEDRIKQTKKILFILLKEDTKTGMITGASLWTGYFGILF